MNEHDETLDQVHLATRSLLHPKWDAIRALFVAKVSAHAMEQGTTPFAAALSISQQEGLNAHDRTLMIGAAVNMETEKLKELQICPTPSGMQ